MDANTYYLDQQLNKEQRADERAEQVKALAGSMMQKGGDYFPFQLENLREALGEIKFSDLASLSASLTCIEKSGVELPLDFITIDGCDSAESFQKLVNAKHAIMFTQEMIRIVSEYWRPVAEEEARKQLFQ